MFKIGRGARSNRQPSRLIEMFTPEVPAIKDVHGIGIHPMVGRSHLPDDPATDGQDWRAVRGMGRRVRLQASEAARPSAIRVPSPMPPGHAACGAPLFAGIRLPQNSDRIEREHGSPSE